VSDPAGKVLVVADLPGSGPRPETASWIAQTSGTYSLRVSTGDAGSYEIEWTEQRQPTPADELRIAAESKIYAAAAKDRAADKTAIAAYSEAADAWRQVHDNPYETFCYARMGQLESEPAKAEAAYQRALAVWRAAGDRNAEAATLSNLGMSWQRAWEQDKALDYYHQAIAIWDASGGGAGLAPTVYDTAIIYALQGDAQHALDAYQRAVKLYRTAGNRSGEAMGLQSLANTYRDLGAEEQALAFYQEALNLEQALGERSAAADTLMGFGDVYFFLGEKQKSIDYYSRSLDIKKTLGDRAGEANCLIGLANVYSNLGNRQKASDAAAADNQKALDDYLKALELAKATGDVIANLTGEMGAGVVYSAMGDKQKAIEYIDKAMTLFDFVRYRPGQGWALYEKARVERDRGNFDEALALTNKARDIIESVRSRTAGQDLRSAFVDAVHDCFELQTDILMKLNRRAEAFERSEGSRARVLLETLGEAYAHIREGVDPKLLDRERTLKAQINTKEMARIQMLASNPFSPAAAETEKTIRGLTTQFDEVRAEIQTRSPRYAALTAPKLLTLPEIQQQVLDPGTVLLEYSLGDPRSYVWAVTATEIAGFELPKRGDIEKVARRYYESLSSQNGGDNGRSLSATLLGPVQAALKDKRVLVAGDGILQYIPFGALPDPSAPGQPLIAAHEVVSVPSASTLAVLRNETKNRKRAPKALAIFADPVFSPDDARIARLRERSAEGGERSESLQRSLNDVGLAGVRLARLPGTRREAAGIAALVPPPDRKQAVDFDASRATLTSPDISNYRILHLATHGLLNSVHPDLSGVVLSLVDRQGKWQDGYLRLNQIYDLKLGADLVVLSACQTGLGKDMRGEGLVGLTRGFMYAGSPRVVASLWKVDDRATAELMQRFYHGMLGSEHFTAAAALRAAQVSMSKTKGFESPYYWAAFTLQGEWR